MVRGVGSKTRLTRACVAFEPRSAGPFTARSDGVAFCWKEGASGKQREVLWGFYIDRDKPRMRRIESRDVTSWSTCDIH